MAPKQRMRIANEKATKNITLRGNVPKSSVSVKIQYLIHSRSTRLNSCPSLRDNPPPDISSQILYHMESFRVSIILYCQVNDMLSLSAVRLWFMQRVIQLLFSAQTISIFFLCYFIFFFFQKSAEDASPVGPWLLALFIFVVCGSGKSNSVIVQLICYTARWDRWD